MQRQQTGEMILWNLQVEQFGGEPIVEPEEPAFVKAIDEARDGGARFVVRNCGENAVDGMTAQREQALGGFPVERQIARCTPVEDEAAEILRNKDEWLARSRHEKSNPLGNGAILRRRHDKHFTNPDVSRPLRFAARQPQTPGAEFGPAVAVRPTILS